MVDMRTSTLIKRYILLVLGLFLNAVGSALVTTVNLGTSPALSLPYVLGQIFRPTVGTFSVIIGGIMILIQVVLLKKDFRTRDLLQIPFAVLFGFFIDLAMLWAQNLYVTAYWGRLGILIVGCVLIALGMYFEVIANVVMVPGEAAIRAINTVFHTNFGTMKTVFDVVLTALAVAFSLIFLHRIEGVREGTVIAAVFTGECLKWMLHSMRKFTAFLLPEEAEA